MKKKLRIVYFVKLKIPSSRNYINCFVYLMYTINSVPYHCNFCMDEVDFNSNAPANCGLPSQPSET